MSKLNIDQKIIKDLFGGKKSDFLIPDYQRPYAWGEKECQTLWELFRIITVRNSTVKTTSIFSGQLLHSKIKMVRWKS